MCANAWACVNPAQHVAPAGCVHESSTGSWVDAEPTDGDR